MLPFVDLHVHLLAGLDDGPATREMAIAMCRQMVDQGTRTAVAVAHQSEYFPGVSATRIRDAVSLLREDLRASDIDLLVHPAGEIMACPELVRLWHSGSLMSLADQQNYLLVEMPHRFFVDLRPLLQELAHAHLQLVLAHAERTEELLFDPGRIEGLISLGTFVQVNAESVTDPPNGRFIRSLRDWFRRGIVHALGSDGHSPDRRPPHMADAVKRVRRWVGETAADRISNTLPRLLLRQTPIAPPPPLPITRRWWGRFW